MTLREKLILVLYKSHSANYTAELLEKEADVYAVDFSDWCKQEYELEDTAFYNKWRDVNGEYKTSKQLLEIFKKEKGL